MNTFIPEVWKLIFTFTGEIDLENRGYLKPLKIELVFMKDGAKFVTTGLLFIFFVFILGIVILDNDSNSLKFLLSVGFIWVVKLMWPKPEQDDE